jgi:hypothetical protein
MTDLIGNKYQVYQPNANHKWKNLSLQAGDIIEVMETRYNQNTNDYGVTAMKINDKCYFIEDYSYSDWCFLLEGELTQFNKLDNQNV